MITPAQFDDAIEALERGVALKTAKTTGFLSYTDINTLAKEFRPYLDHIQRFIVMSLTVASAYIILCTLSWGLLLSINKTMEISREPTGIDSIVSSPLLIFSANSTEGECVEKLEESTLNETFKFVSLNDVLLKRDKPKMDSDFILALRGCRLDEKIVYDGYNTPTIV